MYYAAKNRYASETNIGFCNTWYVVAFPTCAARNEHVQESNDRATKAIFASDYRRYGAVPGKVNFADIWDDGMLVFAPLGFR